MQNAIASRPAEIRSEPAVKIGAAIRELRHDKGWTQRELANRSGVNSGAIRHYEAGRREPDLTKLLLIAAALGGLVFLLGKAGLLGEVKPT